VARMSTENALSATCQRFRDLILGAPVTTAHGVSAGRFRGIDNSYPLARQPASIWHEKPFEVVWTEEGIPDETGPDMLSGDLVDRSATVLIRVGYRHGVGKAITVSDDAYEDARLIRRVLEEPGNYDATNTGIVKVDHQRSRLGTADGDGRVLCEMTFRVRMREDQPT
jgi:hypothetical protein